LSRVVSAIGTPLDAGDVLHASDSQSGGGGRVPFAG
jgi:hypothetical protein